MSRSRNSKWHISWILLGCYFLVATKRISYSRKLHAVTRRITRLKRRKTAEKRNADSKHAPKDFVIADARSEYSASHRSGNFTVKRRIPDLRTAINRPFSIVELSRRERTDSSLYGSGFRISFNLKNIPSISN